MSFENFASAESFFLWSGFFIALVMGAVVNKTNFCTMGAVSDWVNMGDKGRFRAWLLAIAVAMIGVITLESAGMLQANSTFPPYRGGQLAWIENVLGGLLFGIGMTLASGCGNKTLIRIGGGNIKSIFVFVIIGVIAYFMVNPFPGSDQTLMSVLFYDWIRPLSVNVGASQDLGTVVAGSEGAMTARLVIPLDRHIARMARRLDLTARQQHVGLAGQGEGLHAADGHLDGVDRREGAAVPRPAQHLGAGRHRQLPGHRPALHALGNARPAWPHRGRP